MCCGSILVFELIIETIRVNMMGSPIQFARKVINSFKEIPDWFEDKFNILFEKSERNFIHQDIIKEKSNEKRREKRMKKMEEELKKKEEEKALAKMTSKPKVPNSDQENKNIPESPNRQISIKSDRQEERKVKNEEDKDDSEESD